MVGEKEVVALDLSSRKAPTGVPEYGVRQLPSKFSTPSVHCPAIQKIYSALPKILRANVSS